jgi:predicted metal-dependent HD superfamily phosphohydrolase
MRRMPAPTTDFDHRHPALAPLLAAGFPPARIDQALAFYDEPHRAYHNREHLREMLDAAVGSNELLSAQLMRVYSAGLERAVVDCAYGIVLDTAEHIARSAAAEWVLDLDLMRLAAAPADFDRYSRQVFAEQRPLIAIADDAEALAFFTARRIPFFQQLLSRAWIYCTPAARARFEAAARENLRRAIAAAQGSG